MWQEKLATDETRAWSCIAPRGRGTRISRMQMQEEYGRASGGRNSADLLSQDLGPAPSHRVRMRGAKRRRAGQHSHTPGHFVFKPAAPAALCLRSPGRRLTLRSSGPPPAWHLARDPVQVIICLAGQAPHRRGPLSSNVRPHAIPLPYTTSPRRNQCHEAKYESTATYLRLLLATCR